MTWPQIMALDYISVVIDGKPCNHPFLSFFPNVLLDLLRCTSYFRLPNRSALYWNLYFNF